MALGALPKRKRPEVIRRIGLLKTAAIGDTALLSVITRDIAHAFPEAELVLVTGEDNAGVAPLLRPAVTRHVRISTVQPLAAIRTLRAERFDVIADCGSWPRIDAVLTALSGARWRLGFRTRKQHRHYAYDVSVPHSAELHELANYRMLVEALGVRGGSAPRLLAPKSLPTERLPASPFLVFHPWAGGFRGELREWPERRWVELAGRLAHLGRILITGSAAEADRSAGLARRMADAGADHAESVAGRYSLSELADVLSTASLVVSVNTGVMHLAALLGAPTLSLNGPTNERRWGPVGERVVSVNPSVSGCGYLDLGFEYDGQRTDCMEHIAVNDVEAAVRQLVS